MNIKWHYISEEGMPSLKDNRSKAFLICYRAELASKILIGSKTELIPTGEFINQCTIALIQNHESKDGFAHTPSMKFYWGQNIFDNAYAWAEIPDPIEFK